VVVEKLSSILPSNARIKSVEQDDNHPARPGAPSYGRAVGSTPSQRLDRMNISQKGKEAAFNETLAKKNPRESASAKLVDDLSRKFFETRIGPKAEQAYPQTLTEQVANAQVDLATAPSLVIAIPIYNEQADEQVSGNSVDKYA
jgi:hypothetical protein